MLYYRRYKRLNRLYTFIVFTVILGSWNLNASAQNVSFPDANLAAKVRTALNLASGANIPLTSLQRLVLSQVYLDS